MLKVNLFDTNFAHTPSVCGFDSSSGWRKPTRIEYIRNLMEYDGVTLFTDEQMFTENVDRVKSKYKIGWCQESPGIKPYVYSNIQQFEDKFDYILTFHPDLLKRNPAKYKRALIGCSWVNDSDWSIYPKTKAISIIASDKNFAPGHQLRHRVISSVEGLDLWGSGYKRFDTKLDPLKDYMFTIAIMNFKIENYWTEVLTDCFTTGTIPIFWGTPNIGEFFNTDGMIIFDTIDDLAKIKLNKDEYYKRMDAIKDNFERAKTFASTDDMLADVIQDLIKG